MVLLKEKNSSQYYVHVLFIAHGQQQHMQMYTYMC